jgi:hypothetical protein
MLVSGMLVMRIIVSKHALFLAHKLRFRSHSKLLRRIAKGGTPKIADHIWRFQSPKSLGRVIA